MRLFTKKKKNYRKQLRELKKDNKLMFEDIGLMGKEIEKYKTIVAQQSLGLTQAYANTRDMFFGPNEFILGQNHAVWKEIKVTLKGEDVSNKISKILIYGPSFIEE